MSQVSVSEMVAAQTGKIERNELAQVIGEEGAGYPLLSARLIEAMQEYTPTIPDTVLDHILARSGFQTSDPKVKKLIALATQKFVFDVATDALEYCKHRKGAGYKRRKNGDEIFSLTMEDLTASLRDHGVNVVKPDYYVGHPGELQNLQQQK